VHVTSNAPHPQELIAAQAALETERSQAGESSGRLQRQTAEHAALVEGLQGQLAAALADVAQADAAAKQHTYDLAAAYRRADAAEREARAARDELAAARGEAAAAGAAAVRDTAAAAEAARRSEEARGDAERRLAEAVRARDALQAQLEAALAGAQEGGGAGGGGALPVAPTGEGLLDALDASRKDREYLEGRVALLVGDVGRLTRERNLARQDVEALRAEVGWLPEFGRAWLSSR
jgi:hypothetical protein